MTPPGNQPNTVEADVPEWVPAWLSLGPAASVVGLDYGKLKHLVVTGRLKAHREDHSCWYYVRPQDLAEFATERGLPLRWNEID